MKDQNKEKQFDAETYKQKLLGSSHGGVLRASVQAVISAYMPDKEEVDKLCSEEERISRRYNPKSYMRL